MEKGGSGESEEGVEEGREGRERREEGVEKVEILLTSQHRLPSPLICTSEQPVW